MKFLNKNRSIATFFWIFLILLLSAISMMKMGKGFNIETNILKMLPSDNENRLLNEASDRFSEKLSRNVLFVIKHKERDSALSAAAILKNDLSGNNLFKIPKENDWFHFYFDYRFSTIPSAMQYALNENEDFGSFRNYFYKTLFSPLTNIYGEMLNKDPLMLFPQFVNSLMPSQDRFDYENGNIIIEDSAGTNVLISTILTENGFEKEVQTAFNSFIGKQKEKIKVSTGASIEYTGAVSYASRYLERAKFETGLIGMLSFIASVLLILFAFRSFKCLFWGTAPILISLLFGFTASVMVFDKIHMISLTMGMCLIGISTDYCIHYLSEYTFCKGNWDSSKGLMNILPGISLGALTTVMGYSIFFFIPFTGLKQIAVFTIAGLAGAYLSVLILFPLVFKKKGNSGNSYRFFKSPIQYYFKLLDRKAFRYTILSLLSLVMITGLSRVSFIDDIKIFEMETNDLDKTTKKIKEWTGVEYQREFLLITGESQENLLQNIENITGRLDQLRRKGELSDYLALTKFVPSMRTQNTSHKMLVGKILSNENEISNLFQETGFKPQAVEQLLNDLRECKGKYITVDKWLESPVSTEYEKLWLGEIEGHYFSAVLLSGIKSMSALEEIINDDHYTHIINNNSRISQLIENVRKNLFLFVPVLYSVFLLILIIRYGFKQSLRVFTPSLMTFLLTISIFSLFSIEINMMHILALILVLALGVDYSILLAESVSNPLVTCISISLSAATTILSLGMLSLSMIPALKSIGLTILIGISLSIFLSPLAADRKKLLRILQ